MGPFGLRQNIAEILSPAEQKRDNYLVLLCRDFLGNRTEKREQLFEKHWTIEHMCAILVLQNRTNVLFS